jgi:hypothetical protein
MPVLDIKELLTIVDACKDLTKGDRDMDARIHAAVTPGRITWKSLPSGYTMADQKSERANHSLATSQYITKHRGPSPRYTSDLNASHELTMKGPEAVLVKTEEPGYDFILSRTNGGLTVHCRVGNCEEEMFGETPCIAMVRAALFFKAHVLMDDE